MSKPLLPMAALAGLLATAFALPAHGQSLIELYDAASAYDATYQGARAQYDANLARAAQAKAGILPAVGLSANATATHQELSTDNAFLNRGIPTQAAGINATQPLYRPADWATYAQGKRQVDIAEDVLRIAEQDLVVRVSQAYFDVLSSQDSLTLVRAQKIGVAEQLASAKRNFEVGTSTITDTREAQARYDLVLAREIAAENDLQVRKIALDLLVGRPGSQPIPLAAPVVLPAVQPADINAWVTQADDAHPAIEQARLGLEVAKLEVEKAQAGHKPTLDLQLGYNVTNNPNGSLAASDRTRVHAASIALVFNMPLFAGFATENRVKETLALEAQSRESLASTRRSVSQATRAAYLGLVSGLSQVKALEAAAASSQSALDATRRGYQVGVRINIDVLNAQAQLFEARRDLAIARYGAWVDHLKLRQANGTLRASDLQGVNDALALEVRGVAASPTRSAAGSGRATPPPPREPSPMAPARAQPVLVTWIAE